MGEGRPDYTHAHVTITSVEPERAPLPITGTGYLSHFLAPEEIEAAGGPVAYVQAWLDEAAKGREWRRRQVTGVQLSLF